MGRKETTIIDKYVSPSPSPPGNKGRENTIGSREDGKMAHLFSARPDLLLLLLGQVLDEIVEEPDVLGAGGIDPASPHAHRTVGRQFTRVTNLALGTLLAILLPPILFRPPLLTVGHPFVVIAHLEHSSSFHANRTLSTHNTLFHQRCALSFSNEGSTRATAFRSNFFSASLRYRCSDSLRFR